jgi:hypothetical protein
MKELEEQIDELQEHLPEGYTVCIKIQNDAVWCVVEHPNKEEAMINDIGNLREYANKLRKGDEIVSCNNKPPMTVWLTGKQTPCEATNEQHDVFSPYGPYVHLEQFMEKYYGH